MKQITLGNCALQTAEPACGSKLLFRWFWYGIGMAILASALGPTPWGRAAAWAIALAIGLRMACTMLEAK